MKYYDRPAAWFVLIAVAFELSLGAIAFAGGKFWGHWPLVGPEGSDVTLASVLAAIGWGMLATCPLTMGLAILLQSRWKTLAEVSSQAERLLAPLLVGVWPIELVFVALAAGIGEELLFRGLMQAGLTLAWGHTGFGWLTAWLFASAVFGLCHWISGAYAVLAFLAGLYLGWLLLVFDNLLVPITAHGMYDLAALAYLASRARDARDEW